ncbi:MAG: YggS family pyridoxal phosphate-dependent enzyme [Proteobacteria bacterium]|nr:YggS family pyridoxal phosphate-dependent enzyme [Pseudomonadota bacterium]MBU1056837.1 YggS family pyridoxal phosphate-dependent enzyme [Pseudomonadota bacterium]
MIADNLQTIRTLITDTAHNCGRDPSTIKLVAVSKHHPAASIMEAMAAGQNIFGENYIQEAADKCHTIGKGAAFHFIGHLQSNKAKLAAELFTMIETIDRYKLAKALHSHLEKIDKTLDILIQVNIGRDQKKSGILPEEAKDLLKQIASLSRLRPKGLMTMPPFTADQTKTRSYFKALRLLALELGAENLFYNNESIELSMGMSDDFPMAIEEGATLIRIGTAIFGKRPLNSSQT